MLKTFDAKAVKIVFGPVLITGFGDGDFIAIAKEAETFVDSVGSDGEVVRSRSNDNRGTITITCQQTSQANDLLSAIANGDKLIPQDAVGVLPFLCKDLSGRSLYAAAEAWIQKDADATFGRESGNREWVIRCAALISFSGGSGTLTAPGA